MNIIQNATAQHCHLTTDPDKKLVMTCNPGQERGGDSMS